MSTRTHTTWSIACDAERHDPGCTVRSYTAECASASDALATAHEMGWMSERIGGYRYDYSPECWVKHHMTMPNAPSRPVAVSGTGEQG